MPVDPLLVKWIESRPTPEELEEAMEEYRELVGFCVQLNVMHKAPEQLNRVMNWAYTSQMVVLDTMENANEKN